MTLSSEVSRTDYVGNGSVATYATTFPVKAVTEVRAFVTDTDGEVVELSYGADFSAVLSTAGLCSITLTAGNLTDDYILSLLRGMPFTQTYDPGASGAYSPASLGRALDRVVMQIQEVREEVRHALRIPLAEDLDGLLGNAAARASKILGFDLDGVPAMVAIPTGGGGGGGGGGSGTGIGLNVRDYGATGTGLTDDLASIHACIAALGANGGVVYFPAGTYATTARIQVPANVTLLGESAASTILIGTGAFVAGIDLNGDHTTLEGLQFQSTDVARFFVKSNNVNHTRVKRCWFNRAHVSLSNNTATELVGGRIEENLFTGNYLPWVASLNIIEIRGIKSTHILNNLMIGCVSPYRFIKIQASIYWLTGVVGDAYTEGAVVSGNLISGTMTSGKQIVDMFDGVGKAVFSHNVINITGTGTGFTVFLEQKAGDTPSNLFSAWTSELIVDSNVFVGNPTDSLVGMYGAFSLAWEGASEQSVVVSRNLFKVVIPGTMTRGVEFRGVHHAKIENNHVHVTGFGAIFRVYGAGNCKTVNISNNLATAGAIFIWGNASTSGGDPYTGATEQVNICNNTLKNFRSDHGGIELINMVGTPDLIAMGNHLDSDVGTGTLALIYLSNNTLKNVIAVGNVGDCLSAARNRLLETTSTHTLKHEYFNSWQTKNLLEFDTTLHRVTVGDASSSVAAFYEVGSGNQFERYTRVAGFTRHVEIVSATARLLYAYDAAGALIDNYWNENLNAGGRITIGRPIDVAGVVRPTTDNARDLGESNLRWRNLYMGGGMTHGVTAVKVANFTAGDNEYLILVDCSAGNIVCTLPGLLTVRNGRAWIIRRIDNSGFTLTVNRFVAPDTILVDSTSGVTDTIAQGTTAHYIADFAATRYIRMATSTIAPGTAPSVIARFIGRGTLAGGVGSSAAEATMLASLQTSGSLTLPAAVLTANSAVRIRISGRLTQGAGESLQLRCKLGATTYHDTGAVALLATALNDGFSIEIDVAVGTPGVTAPIAGQFKMTYGIGNSGSTSPVATKSILAQINNGAITVDTTGALVVDVTAQWGTASVSNVILVDNITVETLIP